MSTRISRRQAMPVPEDLAAAVHPVLARVLAARDVLSVSELDYGLEKLHPATALSGMDDAVALIVDALDEDKRILVVADFDADGATGCAVAVRGLRLLGAGHVDYVVPNRFEFGYGPDTGNRRHCRRTLAGIADHRGQRDFQRRGRSRRRGAQHTGYRHGSSSSR